MVLAWPHIGCSPGFLSIPSSSVEIHPLSPTERAGVCSPIPPSLLSFGPLSLPQAAPSPPQEQLLRKRGGWQGAPAVLMHLSPESLEKYLGWPPSLDFCPSSVQPFC